jgi:hypothetical protein
VSTAAPISRSEKRNAFVFYSLALSDAQEQLNRALNGEVTGVEETVKRLEEAPRLDDRADQLREELKTLLLRAKSEAEAPASAGAEDTRAASLDAEVTSWKKNYREWLRSTGRQY